MSPSHPPQPANTSRSTRTLALMTLLFIGPLALASVLYYASSWRPIGHSNHGTLIDPPRPLAARFLHGKWSLVYVGAGSCDADCRRTLYFMRQTHLGLGREYARVQRVFLATTPCCDRDYLEHQYPELNTVNTSSVTDARLLAGFPSTNRATAIFIVDPNGNLMMRYDSNDPPRGLLDDLKKLLSLSSIG